MVGRRQFLMAGTVGGAAMLLPQGLQGVPAFASHGTGAGHPDLEVAKTPQLEKYVDPLPRLMTAVPDRSVHRGADYYELTMLQRPWQFHRDLGAGAVWGYWAKNPYDPDMPIGMGYFGPTIVATKDHPTVVKYRTELPTTHLFQHRVDQLHHDSPDMLPEHLSVWNVVHHHGGFTPPQSDGLPLQWFTSEGVHGPGYATLDPRRAAPNEAIYGYTNHEHTSCMLWYHDHAIGITSLNVYAGLVAPTSFMIPPTGDWACRRTNSRFLSSWPTGPSSRTAHSPTPWTRSSARTRPSSTGRRTRSWTSSRGAIGCVFSTHRIRVCGGCGSTPVRRHCRSG